MFAKLSLMSFVYELSELFMSPSAKTKAIYDMYSIDFVYVYQLLANTNSTSLEFVFFLKRREQKSIKMIRDIIFLVILNSKILEKFDVSHQFWEQFGVTKENTRKQPGLYEIEHTEDLCFVTIATNPKEYIEYCQTESINKNIR